MLKMFSLYTLLLTGCVHSPYEYEDFNYRIKILEKKLKLLEMDLEQILDECMETPLNESTKTLFQSRVVFKY